MEYTILLIEDNIYKAIDIERALEACGITDIVRVGFQEDALELIEDGKHFDLIITDMRYPLCRGGDTDNEAGFKLIEYLNKKSLEIPVVICSTSNYENVPEAFGTVWYSELNDIRRDFKNIFAKLDVLNIPEERKKEIDNILKETYEKYKNGEIKKHSLNEFLSRREKRIEELKK